jgi:beta-1,4-mannosyl-glycoprotein beta-1,4-N-acetylglucosaminyltransferase
MTKIYDCFCFFNELELLELRLNILNDVVDYFVISESTVTHTGKPKSLFYEENKDQFKQFHHKIIHIIVEDTPDDFVNLSGDDIINSFIRSQTQRFDRATQPNYGRDFFQKETIRRGLSGCQDDDIIISSDCDEIPRPEVLSSIETILNDHRFITLNQRTYYYYLNLLKEEKWGGSRIGRYCDLKDYSFNELRAQQNYTIEEGGWHFSFMGGADRVRTKIESYSAQEMGTEAVLSNISDNMKNGIDPFFRGRLTKVELDSTYPKFLLDNLLKYEHMIS